MFWKPGLFPLIGKATPHLVDHWDHAILSHRKMAIEHLKLPARLKNKTWTNPHIKNHK
jgi:hypothetical protein